MKHKFSALNFKTFFPQITYSYSLVLEQLNFPSLHTRRHHVKRCSLSNFTLVLDSLLFWGLLVFMSLLCAAETSLCSMSAPQAKTLNLLCSLQIPMLLSGTLTYLEPILYLRHILYWRFLHIELLTLLNIYEEPG